MTQKWHEVSEAKFYFSVGQLDVHPIPHGKWPYWSSWETRDRLVIGRVIDSIPPGQAFPVTHYYLPATAESQEVRR